MNYYSKPCVSSPSAPGPKRWRSIVNASADVSLRGPVRSASQEKADLFEEAVGSRLMLQEQMVPTGQCDEPSTRDAGGQLAPEFEWNDKVVPHVHYKRRRLHLRQKISDIEIADDVEISRRALGRGRFQLQFIEEAPCSCVPPGINRAVNICRKLGLSAPHPRRIKVIMAARTSFSAGARFFPAERERAVQNKV